MRTYIEEINKLFFIKTLKETGLSLVTINDIRKLFNIENNNTLKHLILRMIKAEVLKPLIKGKYIFLFANHYPSDFAISNFLVIPSYISLESALSFWGLLSQFPYRISAVTLSKSKRIILDNKEFIFSEIKKEFFWGYKKIDDFLIAEKEKAVFDYFYLIYKGVKPKSAIGDIVLTAKIKRFLKIYASDKFAKFLTKYVRL